MANGKRQSVRCSALVTTCCMMAIGVLLPCMDGPTSTCLKHGRDLPRQCSQISLALYVCVCEYVCVSLCRGEVPLGFPSNTTLHGYRASKKQATRCRGHLRTKCLGYMLMEIRLVANTLQKAPFLPVTLALHRSRKACCDRCLRRFQKPLSFFFPLTWPKTSFPTS